MIDCFNEKPIDSFYKVDKKSLKWPQVHLGMKYLIENEFRYDLGHEEDMTKFVRKPLGIIEFGVGSGSSLAEISNYVLSSDLDVYLMGYDSWEGLPREKDGIDLFPKYIEGAYKYEYDLKEIKYKIYNRNLHLRKCTFDKIPDEDANMINAAILIHIDSDLYISAYQALDWCFRNNLVIKHSIICFDEYQTVGNKGGEYLAFKEICEKYNPEWREIFHYIYQDKDTKTDVRQNCIEITKIN